MRSSLKKNSGVTLLEMMIVVAIVGIAIFVAKVGINLMTETFAQQALMEVHRDTQLELYNISRDVRNATEILFISSDTLVLRGVNVWRGFDTFTNPDLFSPANVSTITYQYVVRPDGEYLRRSYAFNGTVVDKLVLKNKLISVDNVNYLFFNPYPGGRPESVEIMLRPRLVYNKRTASVFRAEAMKRTPSS